MTACSRCHRDTHLVGTVPMHRCPVHGNLHGAPVVLEAGDDE